MTVQVRNYHPGDAERVSAVALEAFEEFRAEYEDWNTFSERIAALPSLAEAGDLVVGTVDDEVAGAVAYIGPGKNKRAIFPREWPILRMLVVSPRYRGLGLGRALTEACIRRARADGADVIALHTSPIMSIALPMYQRMGFKYYADTEPIFGVPYAIYVKSLRPA